MTTAQEIRNRNLQLDAELRALMTELDPSMVCVGLGGDEWTIGQVLGHLAEFQEFFAADLSRWFADCAAVVGRTHEHEQRAKGVELGRSRGLADLIRACDIGFALIVSELSRITDDDLVAPTKNVKYGKEPLSEFLERYVLGHKAGHLDQLRRAVAAVAANPLPSPEAEVEALLRRSHTLGSDPAVTNFAGGNTSVKVRAIDPATGDETRILYVKGSGGDLGTLTRAGLSALMLDRAQGLMSRYGGPETEDAMVPLFDHCRFGLGGANPSIDTAMHALLPPAHVDHLHPDSIISLAAAVDGERLVDECFGGDVAWVPWRRPGFELGLQLASLFEERKHLRGVVLGGHGLTAWGDTSDECERTSLELIDGARTFLTERGKAEPFGSTVEANRPLEEADRRRRAADLAPVIRGLCSTDAPVIGRFTDTPAVLEFLAGEAVGRLASLGTSCPDHFLRTKVRPLLVDLPPSTPLADQIERIRELHQSYRNDYEAYYQRHATPDSPKMRGADPAIVLLPGIGMFSFGADAPTARIAGEFYVNAINVMRGAEAVSTYQPIPESEKFGIEYWELEERKLALRPRPKPLSGKVAVITGAGSGIGRAIATALVDEGAVAVVTDINRDAAADTTSQLGGRDKAVAVAADVADEGSVQEMIRDACLAFGGLDIVVNCAGLSLSAPLLETTVEMWDRQHDVMGRGSFLVSREAARVLAGQDRGGDIVYIVSKNGVFAGPNNVAYGAAKASQAHQVRLLATELGAIGVRVNGINPDAVVSGSGIFAAGWGAQRAALYGVAEEDLGRFYAERTLLKQEVLPTHVAQAVLALVGGHLSLTTGMIVPVDAGVPAAFLR